MTEILGLRGLVKQYPGHRAVDGVSLSIARGAFFSLLGPSGCGKTTTLRMIAGFEAPDAGEIVLNGAVVNQRKPYERNVSTVFQSYALFPHLSARGNIEFGLRRRGEREIDAKVRDVVQLVNLAGKEDRRPAQLSGGEKQRVALARSLVLAPDVLLLDEPLAALDPKLRQQMRAELKALQRSAGITFLLVTHDQEEALSLSDELAVMNAGRIEQVGTPQDVYLRPQSRFVAGFLGAVNWIGGVGVRPEAMRVFPAGHNAGRPAVATGTVFLGDRVQVTARLESGEDVVVQLPRESAVFRVGDAIHVEWSASDQMVLPA